MGRQVALQWMQKSGGVPSPALMSFCPWFRPRMRIGAVVLQTLDQ